MESLRGTSFVCFSVLFSHRPLTLSDRSEHKKKKAVSVRATRLVQARERKGETDKVKQPARPAQTAAEKTFLFGHWPQGRSTRATLRLPVWYVCVVWWWWSKEGKKVVRGKGKKKGISSLESRFLLFCLLNLASISI
jgi:hypothetical protein